MVLSLHIGAGFEVIRRAPEAPIDHLMVLSSQISAITAQDLLFGPTLRALPGSQGRPVRGRHRVDPVLLRPHRPPRPRTRSGCTTATTSAASSPPRCSGSTSSPATSPTRPACCSATASASTSSPGSATTRTPTRRGRSRPSSPGTSSRKPAAVTTRSTRSPGENAQPVLRLGPVRAHPEGAGDCRRAAGPRDRRRCHPHGRKEEWRKRNEAAGIGVF